MKRCGIRLASGLYDWIWAFLITASADHGTMIYSQIWNRGYCRFRKKLSNIHIPFIFLS